MPISTKLDSILTSISAIRTSIRNKGGSIPDGMPLSEWAAQLDALTVIPPTAEYTILTAPETNLWVYYGEPITRKDFDNTLGVSSWFNNWITSYLKFDISDIPTNAVVKSAVLRMTVAYLNTYGSDAEYSVHKILANWDPAVINWQTQPAHAAATIPIELLGPLSVRKEYDLTTMVQEWVTAAASNYGVAFVGNMSPTHGADRTNGAFFSTRHEDSAVWPWLEITYESEVQSEGV